MRPTRSLAKHSRRDLPRRLQGAIRLVHPFPAGVVVVTTLLLILIAHRGNPGVGFLGRALAVILLSQIAVGACNDYVDRKRDAIVQPDKPIPSGLASPALAMIMTVASLVAFLPFAASFGREALALAVVAVGSGLAYDLWLKSTPFSLLGYLVSFLALVTWVWTIAGSFDTAFLLVYPAGIVALLAAHLANSFPDIESDTALGENGLASLLGTVWTFRVIFLSYALVNLGGLIVALVRGRVLAIMLLTIAAAIGVFANWWNRDAPSEIGVRDRLFRLMAPGIGIVATGCLLAINPG
jgi:4-hydroxybenzoate polyprenyltransferase